MRRWAGVLLLAGTAVVTSRGAQTAQQLGLPTPVAFEAVFPEIVFGTVGSISYETEITVSNPTDTTALLEVELTRSDGTPAAAEMSVGWTAINGFQGFPQRGPGNSTVYFSENKFYRELTPRSVGQLSFRTEHAPAAGAFLGWAMLRSNSAITATQSVRVVYLPSAKASSATLAANVLSATSARFRAANSSCPFVQPPWGFRNFTSGVALVNPGTVPLQVTVAFGGVQKQLQVAPRTQKSFFVGDLFGFSLAPLPGPAEPQCAGSAEILQIAANGPFAFATVLQEASVDPGGNLTDLAPDIPDRLPVAIGGPGSSGFFEPLRAGGTKPFDFPVSVLLQTQLQDLQLTLTRFGVYVRRQNESARVFKTNNGTGIVTDQKNGVAVIEGSSSVPILFARSGKVVFADTSGQGGPAVISETGDPVQQQLRISVGSLCLRTSIIISKETEEILSIGRDPSAYCYVK